MELPVAGSLRARAWNRGCMDTCVVLHLTQYVQRKFLCHGLRFSPLEIRSNDNLSLPSTSGENQCLMVEPTTLKPVNLSELGLGHGNVTIASSIHVL